MKQTRCPKCGLWKNKSPFNLEDECICGRRLPGTGNWLLAAGWMVLLAIVFLILENS